MDIVTKRLPLLHRIMHSGAVARSDRAEELTEVVIEQVVIEERKNRAVARREGDLIGVSRVCWIFRTREFAQNW